MAKKKNPHLGSSVDGLWDELGILEDVSAIAIKRTVALQIQNEMEAQGISKAEMARRMKTSAAQFDRVLDPEYEGVNLSTLVKAAAAVGKQLTVSMI